MKPSLVQRFKLLQAAAKIRRMENETRQLIDEVREAEGATCGYCGQWRTWKNLTDESTQTRQQPLICSTCLKRREMAYRSGWHDWPNRQ